VQVAAGENVARVQARLVECLPDDVAVFTKAEFIGREKTFWRKSTPVGYIFTVGVVVGFLVGVIVCYQIIYADITDHIPEFATLKAMGYRDRYFIGLVLTQSSYLSVLGFVPGCLVSVGMYRLLAGVTGLTMQLKGTTTAAVFAATLLMCAISGLLAVRRLAAADPAELY
jgi:putative ABC transport system permease protein